MLPACVETLTVSPWPSPEILVNTTLTCSAAGAAPEPTIYYLLNGSIVVSTDATITVAEPGPFDLTCVANSSFNGLECYNTTDVSGIAVLSALLVVIFLFIARQHTDAILI